MSEFQHTLHRTLTPSRSWSSWGLGDTLLEIMRFTEPKSSKWYVNSLEANRIATAWLHKNHLAGAQFETRAEAYRAACAALAADPLPSPPMLHTTWKKIDEHTWISGRYMIKRVIRYHKCVYQVSRPERPSTWKGHLAIHPTLHAAQRQVSRHLAALASKEHPTTDTMNECLMQTLNYIE